MEKRDYYRIMFIIAGAWNIVTAFPVWLLGLFEPATFASFGMTAPPSLFFAHAMLWFIIAFGVGYILASRNIEKNHGVVVLGVFSKIAFGVDAFATVAMGEAGPILLVFGSWDLLFAILFAEFLLWTKRQSKT
jgi:hypothetical protein